MCLKRLLLIGKVFAGNFMRNMYGGRENDWRYGNIVDIDESKFGKR